MTFNRHDFPGRYFPQEEYEDRWERVQREMKAREYEHAVVWGRTAGSFERAMEVQWLTNFSSSHSGQWADAAGVDLWHANGFSCAMLSRGAEPELHGDEPSPRPGQIAVESYTYHRDPIAGVAARLRELVGSGRVAFVGTDCLPVKYGQELIEQTPDIEYQFDDDLVRVCREIKSPRELDCVREGAEIASSALYRLMDSLYAGKPGTEAAAEAAHEIVRRGGLFHRMQMNWGDSAYSRTERAPFYGLAPDAPDFGEMAWALIYGPIHQGYWHDPGRTLVAGRTPSSDQRQLLEDTYSILQVIMEQAKPGLQLKTVAEMALSRRREVIESDERTFSMVQGKDEGWPYFGHGNGMVWEPPYLFFDPTKHREDEVFREGQVIGIEAWISREGVGHADFEENIVLTSDGIEVISKAPVFWH